MPFRTKEAAEELVEKFRALRDNTIAAPPFLIGPDPEVDTNLPTAVPGSLLVATAKGDRIEAAIKVYR